MQLIGHCEASGERGKAGHLNQSFADKGFRLQRHENVQGCCLIRRIARSSHLCSYNPVCLMSLAEALLKTHLMSGRCDAAGEGRTLPARICIHAASCRVLDVRNAAPLLHHGGNTRRLSCLHGFLTFT